MKIAILGFGTVGKGLYEVLKGTSVEVKRICDLVIPENVKDLASTIDEIAEDSEIELVVESMGGIKPAYQFVTKCLEHKKNVVTSNKHLICTYYTELLELASKNGVTIEFSASTGGGVQWIHNLERMKRSDRIQSIEGIVNGTSNYILDKMFKENYSFDDALKKAQELGYAEKDPTADICGFDSARKCAISSSIAYDTVVKESDVVRFGIENISDLEKNLLKKNNLALRLIAMSKRIGENEYVATVCPVIMNDTDLFFAVPNNYNYIVLDGENVGKSGYFGQGAGSLPTGATLAQDIFDIQERRQFVPSFNSSVVQNNDAISFKYFVHSKEKVDGIDQKCIASEYVGIIHCSPMKIQELVKDHEGAFVAIVKDDVKGF